MRRLLKWSAVAAGIVVASIAAIALYIYVGSERVLARTYDVPLRPFDAPSDSASISKGKRLATIYGCNNCHGSDMQGVMFIDDPMIGRVAAPNLTRIVKEYTDSELERLIRHGVKRDGTSAWIMPAGMFRHITDEDLANVIAFVRSSPERDGIDRERSLKPFARLAIATEKFLPSAQDIDTSVRPAAPDYSDPISLGRYMVMTACTECHGQRLEGRSIGKLNTPNLAVAAAYSEKDFNTLMRTGIGLNGRNLGLMTEMGKVRFSSFRDEEVRAVRAYLSLFVQQGAIEPP